MKRKNITTVIFIIVHNNGVESIETFPNCVKIGMSAWLCPGKKPIDCVVNTTCHHTRSTVILTSDSSV